MSLKNLIISEAKRRRVPLKQLAYVLATADWETNHTFEPVEEAYWVKNPQAYRKKLRYYPYYGRGLVQLTWEENYRHAGNILKKNFVKNPALVMEPKTAVTILIVGMIDGWFTKKKLGDYINDKGADYVNARRIINGMDKAQTIAGLAVKYEKELVKAGYSLEPTAEPVQPVSKPSGKVVSETLKRPWWAFLIDLLFKLLTRKK